MINYYKFKVSSYKIDTDSKSFTQVNDAEDASSVSVITNEKVFTSLSKFISDNIDGGWLVISEEEFNFTKQNIFNKLIQ
jgi:hypothetical protein